MNIIRLSKNILTAAALVLMAAGLSSCYFRLSDDAKNQLKNELRRYPEGEADSVSFHKAGPGDMDASELKAKSVTTQENGIREGQKM